MCKMFVRIVSVILTLCLVTGMSVFAQIQYDLNNDGEINKCDVEYMKEELLYNEKTAYHLSDLVKLYRYTKAPIEPQIGTAYVAYKFTDEAGDDEQANYQTVLEALLPTSDYTVTYIRSEMASNSHEKNKMTIHLVKGKELEMDINIVSSKKKYRMECQNNFVIFFDFEQANYAMIA